MLVAQRRAITSGLNPSRSDGAYTPDKFGPRTLRVLKHRWQVTFGITHPRAVVHNMFDRHAVTKKAGANFPKSLGLLVQAADLNVTECNLTRGRMSRGPIETPPDSFHRPFDFTTPRAAPERLFGRSTRLLRYPKWQELRRHAQMVTVQITTSTHSHSTTFDFRLDPYAVDSGSYPMITVT